MLFLILGVALWWGAHQFRYIAPEARARLGEEKGKGIIAITLVVAIVLMVIGYRSAQGAFFWGRSPMMVGIVDLLMLVSFYLFAAAGAQTRLAARMRHPMLAGFKTWALAHLLVNGDVPSFILFGGLLGWAVSEMILINKAKPNWTPPEGPFPMGKEIGVAVSAVVLYGAVAYAHLWLGYPPFG